jgi:hypothetical protein
MPLQVLRAKYPSKKIGMALSGHWGIPYSSSPQGEWAWMPAGLGVMLSVLQACTGKQWRHVTLGGPSAAATERPGQHCPNARQATFHGMTNGATRPLCALQTLLGPTISWCSSLHGWQTRCTRQVRLMAAASMPGIELLAAQSPAACRAVSHVTWRTHPAQCDALPSPSPPHA